MADNRKYYYLKLKEDFFDTDEMKILESICSKDTGKSKPPLGIPRAYPARATKSVRKMRD